MLEGVVNVLKPPGMSSSDVVTDIRHIFNMKRVGHTGHAGSRCGWRAAHMHRPGDEAF